MNNTRKLQDYFNRYISCDNSKKDSIITECKKELPNQTVLIDRLRKDIDSLNNNELSLQLFINKVFDIQNDQVNIELMENMESLDRNRTRVNPIITNKALNIIKFSNYKIEKSTDYFYESNNAIYDTSGNEKIITDIDSDDNRFYNYIIENLLGYKSDELVSAKDEENNYLISSNNLTKSSSAKLVKEDSICTTKEVEYFIDRIIENADKQKVISRIFIDLITNQNYRDLSLGYGTLNSDSKENDYYVLNNATIKKIVAIDSLYINYYDEISKISNLIIQNYDKLMNLIDEIFASDISVNKTYLNNLKKNLALVYEKGKIQQSLDEIDTGKKAKYIQSENSKQNILDFEESLNIKKAKVRVRNIETKQAGYASIFILVGGIMIFGVFLAYLILKI